MKIPLKNHLEKTMKEIQELTKCKYYDEGFCLKIKHFLNNGVSILAHCKNCKYRMVK